MKRPASPKNKGISRPNAGTGDSGPKAKKPGTAGRFDPKALSEESRRTAARQRTEQKNEERGERAPKRDRKEAPGRPGARGTDKRDDSKKPFERGPRKGRDEKPHSREERKPGRRTFETTEEAPVKAPAKKEKEPTSELMTLNKYLAHSGVSSRRDAAEIIKQGKVTVNGAVKTEPGYRVQVGDKVLLEGKKMEPIQEKFYVLLNKPKGFITTTEDDKGRRTVMELVASAGIDRLYPVGRLDRNTTGVLLLTNDGDLAQKLSHPKYEAKKIYQVTLDKPLTKTDFDKVLTGVELEDGMAHVDKLAYLAEKNEIGLEIHSGRNRIVRRIFEALGYNVDKLDRVMYAGLTKKNLPRGKWRMLTEKEVILLKHFKQ